MDEHQFVKVNPPRKLSEEEIDLLKFLLSAEFKGNILLLRQIEAIKVSEECVVCHSIRFIHMPSDIKPITEMNNLPVEAEGKDEDGAPIHVMLFVVNGFIDELSVYREDLAKIKKLPNPRNLQLTVW